MKQHNRPESYIYQVRNESALERKIGKRKLNKLKNILKSEPILTELRFEIGGEEYAIRKQED